MSEAPRPRPRQLMIVNRTESGLYDYLVQAFAGVVEVAVTYDRRHSDRRRTVQATKAERRRCERRTTGPDREIKLFGWAVVKLDGRRA